jgi:hypothetical protein
MTETRRSQVLWCCRLCVVSCLVAVVPLLWTSTGQVAGQGTGQDEAAVLRITTLSAAKPHLVSGGDVLVRVEADETIRLADVAVLVDGVDVTQWFRPDPEHHGLLGVVTGLSDGDHVLAARAGRVEAREQLTSYPVTGPMISGPHEQPFHCQTEEFELVTGELLGTAQDAHCSVETRVDYVYRSTDGEYKPFPDGARPADLATTTTTDGHTVPFIVRVQTGTVNRAIYESALLHDPATPAPDVWNRSTGWNGRLVYTHGGGCRGGWYQQGRNTGGVLRDGLLDRGYAVTSATLNVFGQNCNDLLASETHMMVKERFVESYGAPIFTIGTGGSGGSYQSHQTADNYPGVFDGIIVRASFPDVTSATIFTLADARLLHHYFTSTAPGLFTQAQQRAAAGFGEWGSIPNLSRGAARIDPIFQAAVNDEEQGGEVSLSALEADRYHPTVNPDGVRATVYDHTVNVYGLDADTGFAARPLDNVGVQYGLAALQSRQITVDQFLDLNEHIGGLDADANHVPDRHVANEHATRMALETGRILDGGGGLAMTPVIDYRSYTDDRENGDIHMKVHQHSTRARLVEANGHADNHVMVVQGRWGFTQEAPDLGILFDQMDRWLTALAVDNATDDPAGAVVRARPVDLTDACWDNRNGGHVRVDQAQAYDGEGLCNDLYPAFPTPRLVAGAPLTNNIVKCALKPISPDDYALTLTGDQRARLERIFPDGVCDWSRAGEYASDLRGTWLSFGPSPVNRVR